MTEASAHPAATVGTRQLSAPEVRIVHDSEKQRAVAVTHQLVRGWHLVVVHGDLTVEMGYPLTTVLDAIVATGAQRVIIDLARSSAIEPACVRALADAETALRLAGGKLCLVVDGVVVLQAIRAAGLSGRFEMHRYVGDIVGAVAGLDEGGRGRRRDMLALISRHR